ncbi:MAG: hypothetical protein ACC656_01260, partial [Candidatus Heimdallarchaeota archaeon]
KTVLPLALSLIPGIGPILSVIASVALGLAARSKAKKKAKADSSLANKGSERRQIIRSSISSRRYIYGRSSVSGTLIFAETSGAKKEFLHMVVTVASHEIEAIDDIYFNDIKVGNLDGNGNVTSGQFKNFARIKKHLGESGQVADANLVAETSSWTNAHVGNGIAYVYIRLKWDENQKAFPTGIPTPRFVVRGKNDLLDPRDSSVGYSENNALCCYDYLRGSFGYRADDAEIDTASVIAAANVCDEQVQNPDLSMVTRYNCNGTFDLDEKLGNVMEDLLSSMGGTLVEHQGTFRIYAAMAGTTTRATLTEDDLRGNITINPAPTRDNLFNEIRGLYTSPVDKWLPTDFKPVTLIQWQIQDGGEKISFDIELPFTIDEYQAQRLAWIELKLARNSLTYSVPVKLTALDIATWDTVNWSIANLGWVDKSFRVIGWKLGDNGGISLIMREESSTSYDDDVNELQPKDNTPNTILPDGFETETISGITLDTGDNALVLSGSTVISGIIINFIPSGNTQSILYEIQFKKFTDTVWTTTPNVVPPKTTLAIRGVEDGIQYDVRIRAINGLGISGVWAIATVVVIGKTAPPPDVQVFNVLSQSAGTREFTWNYTTITPPLDLAGYKIKGLLGSGFVWDDMPLINTGLLTSSPWETNTLSDAGLYTFGIKAFDTSGNESVNALIIEVILDSATSTDLILERKLESIGWPGIKTNAFTETTPFSTELVVSSIDTWGTLPNQWDNWNLWTQNLYSSATYVDDELDVGSDLTFKINTAVQLTNLNVLIEYRWKIDGGVYNAYQSVVGLITARFIQTRITLSPIGLQFDSRINSAVIRISAPVVVEEISDLDTSALSVEAGGGVRLALTKSFAQINTVFIAFINVGTGFTWEIIDKDSVLGPHIRMYDSSNTLAYPVIDAQIRGI